LAARARQPGLAAGAIAVVILAGPVGGQSRRPGPLGDDNDCMAFERPKVTGGVYQAVGTGAMGVGADGAVLINESDVLLVDSDLSPEGGLTRVYAGLSDRNRR